MTPKVKAKQAYWTLYNYYYKTATILTLSLWLIANIATSQLLSPLYFDLVNEKRLAAVNYLRQLRLLPVFTAELEKYRQIYGGNIDNFVFAGDNEKRQMIAKYEEALKKNPDSVTALYNLSLLYSESSELQKAEEYMSKAKELDPNITKKPIANSNIQ